MLCCKTTRKSSTCFLFLSLCSSRLVQTTSYTRTSKVTFSQLISEKGKKALLLISLLFSGCFSQLEFQELFGCLLSRLWPSLLFSFLFVCTQLRLLSLHLLTKNGSYTVFSRGNTDTDFPIQRQHNQRGQRAEATWSSSRPTSHIRQACRLD